MDSSSTNPCELPGDPNLAREISLARWFAFYFAFLAAGGALAWYLLDHQSAAFHEAVDYFGTIAHNGRPWYKMLGQMLSQVAVVIKFASPELKLVLLTIYMAAATTVFPLPTSAVLAAVATSAAGFGASLVELLLVVPFLAAAASVLANLTDYHIFLAFLRSRRIAKIRNTRACLAAEKWLDKGPFQILLLVSVLPIPLDIPVRMLTAIYGYPRLLFSAAVLCGRFVRYFTIVLLTHLLGAQDWLAPLVLLALGAAIALSKLLPRAWKRR